MAKRSVAAGVVGYVDQVLAELTQQAPKAIAEGNVSAVHRARVATRRLGAAMHVAGGLVGGEDLRLVNRALKRIRRSVQDLRDLDVMQEHLADRAKRLGTRPGAEACQRLGRMMAEQRAGRYRQVLEKARVERWLSRVGHWMALRGALIGKKDELRARLLATLEEQFGAFAAQATRLSDGLLGQVEQAGQEGQEGQEGQVTPGVAKPVSDIEPHALRIAGKSLRYTFEMAQAQGLPVADATLRGYKKLQDALGLWHDYHVLSQQMLECCVREMGRPPFRWDEDELMLLAAAVMRDSHRELKRFALLWRKHEPTLMQQLAKVLPQPLMSEVMPLPIAAANELPVPQDGAEQP